MNQPSIEELGQPLEWVLKRLAAAAAARTMARPSDAYNAGRQDWPEAKRYQLQFHQAPHVIRAMFPGNGAGKTTVSGIEADYWLQHNHPYQPTPTHNIQVIWVCLKFQQMDVLRQQLETYCLTPGWRFNESKHKYTWPNGSSLWIVSNDGEWSTIQGVPVDLVVIDEECDERLWRELTMRRRGRHKTRYVISATATRGKRWMYREIYVPWREYHNALGIAEDDACLWQQHPTRWVWPKGGVEDNPLSEYDEGNVRWYEDALAYASAAERQVRLHGGFSDLNASPVFDQENLELMVKRAKLLPWKGQVGILVPATKRKRPSALAEYEFQAGPEYAGGKITIYEPPDPNDRYVLGADFGAGLENRDWDAVVVLSQKHRRQVAQARGRWGDVHMAWVLWALGWYYNEALIVGERQFGLPALRRLYDEWGYTYLYTSVEDEAEMGPRKSDKLGHHRSHGDVIIPRLQWAIAPMEKDSKGRITGKKHPPVMQFVDPILLGELVSFEWRPKAEKLEMTDATWKDLTCGAPKGEFDDVVLAAAYAVHGWIELPRFVKKAPQFSPGSLGVVLGHERVLEKAADPRAGKVKSAFAFAPPVKR